MRGRTSRLLAIVVLFAACTGGAADDDPDVDVSPSVADPTDIAAATATGGGDGAGPAAGPGASSGSGTGTSETASASSSAGGLGTATVPVDVHVPGPGVAIAVATNGPRASLAGVADASTVIEYPVARDRTAALVVSRAHEQPVGPIRRAGATDARYASAWGATLVATTASPAALRTARLSGRGVIEEGAPPGVVLRDPSRRAPFNTYAVPATVAGVRSTGEQANAEDAAWHVGLPPSGGDPTDVLAVRAAPRLTVTWRYDTRPGRWRREIDSRERTNVDGAPTTVGTVAVIETSDPGYPTGQGPAVVARAGRSYAATWRGDGSEQRLRITGDDGSSFPVDGTVWLHVCAASCLTRTPR